MRALILYMLCHNGFMHDRHHELHLRETLDWLWIEMRTGYQCVVASKDSEGITGRPEYEITKRQHFFRINLFPRAFSHSSPYS